ncbi:MAG: hypothetical protein M1834_004605 [Cirrosporium novae-zelandiae]|nr:MAG: hypothetical protein M1834_004605 [Cirrosporium novae-zelandiae]
MERPTKRPRLDSSVETAPSPDPDTELQFARERNDLRLKSRFESIFEKYGHDFTGIGDEIDLETGQIVENNGHISGMRDEQDIGHSSSEIGEDAGRLLRAITMPPGSQNFEPLEKVLDSVEGDFGGAENQTDGESAECDSLLGDNASVSDSNDDADSLLGTIQQDQKALTNLRTSHLANDQNIDEHYQEPYQPPLRDPRFRVGNRPYTCHFSQYPMQFSQSKELSQHSDSAHGSSSPKNINYRGSIGIAHRDEEKIKMGVRAEYIYTMGKDYEKTEGGSDTISSTVPKEPLFERVPSYGLIEAGIEELSLRKPLSLSETSNMDSSTHRESVARKSTSHGYEIEPAWSAPGLGQRNDEREIEPAWRVPSLGFPTPVRKRPAVSSLLAELDRRSPSPPNSGSLWAPSRHPGRRKKDSPPNSTTPQSSQSKVISTIERRPSSGSKRQPKNIFAKHTLKRKRTDDTIGRIVEPQISGLADREDSPDLLNEDIITIFKNQSKGLARRSRKSTKSPRNKTNTTTAISPSLSSISTSHLTERIMCHPTINPTSQEALDIAKPEEVKELADTGEGLGLIHKEDLVPSNRKAPNKIIPLKEDEKPGIAAITSDQYPLVSVTIRSTPKAVQDLTQPEQSNTVTPASKSGHGQLPTPGAPSPPENNSIYKPRFSKKATDLLLQLRNDENLSWDAIRERLPQYTVTQISRRYYNRTWQIRHMYKNA